MTTALDLTPEERERYLQQAKPRPKPPLSPEQLARQAKRLTQAHEAARHLKERFGGITVLLFGSLAHRAWWYDQSDIDLAVKGLADADFWEAWRLVEEIIQDCPVDLVLYESARPSLQHDIDQDGITL